MAPPAPPLARIGTAALPSTRGYGVALGGAGLGSRVFVYVRERLSKTKSWAYVQSRLTLDSAVLCRLVAVYYRAVAVVAVAVASAWGRCGGRGGEVVRQSVWL